MNPAAMTLDDAAAVLARAGGDELSIADIEAAIAAGCPTNHDGTLHLVQLAAWLAGQTQ